MKYEVLEKSALYFTLLLFCMMVSCFYLEIKENYANKLLHFFRKRIEDRSRSDIWRHLYLFLRYV